MDYLKKNKKQISILTLLLVGIILGVYLVQTQKIFKSKANLEIYNTFNITQTTQSGENKTIECQENNCQIESSDIEIKSDVDELERLIQE